MKAWELPLFLRRDALEYKLVEDDKLYRETTQ